MVFRDNMKGNIASEGRLAPDPAEITILVTILFVSVLFINTILAKLKPDPHKLINSLKRDPSMVIEDAGESSTEYLFTLSISTLQQSFDLNMVYEQLRGSGCRLVSTADSAHPSYRKLSIFIPKSTSSGWYAVLGVSALTTLVLGISLTILAFQVPMLYNYFTPWILKINDFVQTQTP